MVIMKLYLLYIMACSDGEVCAIHHNGTEVSGFPVNLMKMMVGAAAGDLEGDGQPDIVVCTWDDNIYAIDNTGAIKEGFLLSRLIGLMHHPLW